MDSSSSESPQSQNRLNPTRSWLKLAVVLITWFELIVGLSAISAAVFMNRRVPVLLYAFYGAYFAMFLWLLYSSFRSAYLKTGPLPHAYWICIGCSIATIAVVLLTFLTSPNSGEIAFVAAIVFCVSLVLSPVIGGIFFCLIRGNISVPQYMRGKKAPQFQKGFDEPDTSRNGIQPTHPQDIRTQV